MPTFRQAAPISIILRKNSGSNWQHNPAIDEQPDKERLEREHTPPAQACRFHYCRVTL